VVCNNRFICSLLSKCGTGGELLLNRLHGEVGVSTVDSLEEGHCLYRGKRQKMSISVQIVIPIALFCETHPNEDKLSGLKERGEEHE